MDGPRTVLVIDDDRDNVAICSALLEYFGFRVIAAGDVASGVRLAAGSRPAVVITELFSRTRTGWAALETLGARPETAGIPVIVLSAHALPGDRAAAGAATTFLAKPTHPLQILDQVRRACEASA